MYKVAHAWYPDNNPFICFENTHTTINLKNLTKEHVLFLWGGSDIATEIYKETPCKYVDAHIKSKRDQEEIDLFHKAVDLQIPIIGICRGAQLICCLTGGSLIQHIDNHIGDNHYLYTKDKLCLETNSCHHQMMLPTKTQEILAWATETWGLSKNNKILKVKKIPEIVHFPEVRALGIQGHPEWNSMPKTTVKYCQSLIEDLLL